MSQTDECIEPDMPGEGATNQEWADYFIAYGEYLECVAENSGTTTFAQRLSSFQAFTAAARVFGNSLNGG